MTLPTPEQLEAAAKLLCEMNGRYSSDKHIANAEAIILRHAQCAEALRQAMQPSKKDDSWKSWLPGQEVVCPDGIGRVVKICDLFPTQWVKVSTYINDRQCEWAPENVRLTTENDRAPAEQYIALAHIADQYVVKIRDLEAERYELRAALGKVLGYIDTDYIPDNDMRRWRKLAEKE